MRYIISSLIVLFLTSCHGEHYVRNRVIRLTGANGSCSGTQVRAPSGKDVILTAGHCAILAASDGTIQASTDYSRSIPRHILEVSSTSDLMVLEGLPDLSGLALGSDPRVGDLLIAYTHGLGLDTYKDSGELVQISRVDVMDHILVSEEDAEQCKSLPKNRIIKVPFFLGIELEICVLSIQAYTTTMHHVVPGSSGGTVVNSLGDIVGVVFASDGHFGMIVASSDIHSFLAPY